MSRVAIKGNASGTATYTLEAPAGSTDRTLVLPDEAGTVLTSASSLGVSQLPAQLSVNGSASSGSLAIDSAGRVTKPYQPMCFVTRTSNQTGISSDADNPTDLVLNTQIFNVGSHFNDVNSRWTAPVAGKYEFSWSYATQVGSASVYRTFLWKNGSKLQYTQLRNDSTGNSSNYNFASRTAILDLAANDYVVLRASIDGAASTWYSDSELRTVLTVRLIA